MAGKITKTKTSKVQSENESLRSEFNDLKSMMMQFMQNQNSAVSTPKSEEKEQDKSLKSVDNNNSYEDISILPTQLLNVTSLFTGGLSLIGSHGKPIRFERFGQTMPITFEDLNHVCSNNRKFAEEGYFYIHNMNAVKLLYLQDAYEKIIDAKAIENIITLPTDKIKEIYEKVAKNIKVSIIDVILKGIMDNKPLYADRNKIDFISNLFGKDLNIVVKNLKEYDQE